MVLRSNSDISPGSKLPTPAHTHLVHPGSPSQQHFYTKPGDVLVQFRTELYYRYSSRGPWVPNAVRESWGSRDGLVSLEEE